MRKIEPKEFYLLAGVSSRTFAAARARNETALAYGIRDPLAGGIFMDLDVISTGLVDELTPAFGREFAATLIKMFSDVWCEAVAEADITPSPVFLVVIEEGGKRQGEKLEGRRRANYEGVNMGYCTLAKLAEGSASAARLPPRMTLINVAEILARIRTKASAMGLDFSAPFVDLNDPLFIQARDEAKKDREARVRRVGARS